MTGFRPIIVRAAALAAALAAPLPAQAPGQGSAACFMRIGRIADAPRFEDYPAPRQRVTRAAGPLLATPEARRYRSVLGMGAARGPNFAGAFTIARWGCGATCTDFAIIDARSGRVFFPAGLRPIAGAYVGDDPATGESLYDSLRFRPDSRLIVLVGAPQRDGRREGATWLEWTGTALRPLRFIPRDQLCAQ